MFSASSAQRVEVCPPSEVLAQVMNVSEAADQGSAGHEHMHLRGTVGVDAAVGLLDETLAKWNVEERDAAFLRSRLLKFEWSPPKGAAMEIRLALMPDFTVKRVPAELRFFPGAIFTGQFDVMWSEPQPLILKPNGLLVCPPGSVLAIADYKLGKDSWVHTIEANLQLMIYAFLAARWTGAERVTAATIFPGPGEGDWDTFPRPWGARQLVEMEKRIRDLLASVERNQKKLEAGEALELKEGRHCLYCPARSHCPAKTAMFKRVFDSGAAAALGNAPLTPDQARYAANALPEFARFAKELREALELYVEENGPIPVDDDGVVWGPLDGSSGVILPGPARDILRTELGLADADEVLLRPSISKKAIEEVVKRQHEDAGIKRRLRPTMGRILGKLEEVGAMTYKAKTTWCAHRPSASPALLAMESEGEEV